MLREVLRHAILLAALAAGNAVAQRNLVDPGLRAVLDAAEPTEQIAVIVGFSDSLAVLEADTQRSLREIGATELKVLWIINSIALQAPAGAIGQIAEIPGVEIVRLDDSTIVRVASSDAKSAVADEPEDELAPQHLLATHTAQTSVTLAWDPPSASNGPTRYRLYEDIRSSRVTARRYLMEDGIASRSTRVTELVPGSTHTFAVAAVHADGREAVSAPLTVTSLRAPTAYHAVRTSREGPTAVVDEPFSYRVTAVGVPSPSFSLVAGPHGMEVDRETGLVQWTPDEAGTVNVTVRAANSEGQDEHSFSIDVVPAGTDREPPSAVPYPIVTDVTSDGGRIRWRPATDDQGVTGYLIYAQRDGRGQSLRRVGEVEGDRTVYIITGLESGAGYRIWVQAYDASGNKGVISGTPPGYLVTSSSQTRTEPIEDSR